MEQKLPRKELELVPEFEIEQEDQGPGNWVIMVANVRIDNTVDSFVIVPIDPKSNKLLWDRQWGPGVKRT